MVILTSVKWHLIIILVCISSNNYWCRASFHVPLSHLYVFFRKMHICEIQKMAQMSPCAGRNRHTYMENRCVGVGECVSSGLETDASALPRVKQATSGKLLWVQGAQLFILWWPRWVGWRCQREGLEGGDTCVHIAHSFCCTTL